MFFNRFLNNQKGGAQIAIAIFVSGISVTYFLHLNKMYQELSQRATNVTTKETLINKIESIRFDLSNTDILYEVIGDSRNNFSCVTAGTCTYNRPPTEVYISHLDGEPLANPTNSGFDRHGNYCTLDQNRCLFSIKVFWKPLCLSRVDCSEPHIILYPEIRMNSRLNSQLQFNPGSRAQGISAVLDPETVVEKLRIKEAIERGESY